MYAQRYFAVMGVQFSNLILQYFNQLLNQKLLIKFPNSYDLRFKGISFLNSIEIFKLSKSFRIHFPRLHIITTQRISDTNLAFSLPRNFNKLACLATYQLVHKVHRVPFSSILQSSSITIYTNVQNDEKLPNRIVNKLFLSHCSHHSYHFLGRALQQQRLPLML